MAIDPLKLAAYCAYLAAWLVVAVAGLVGSIPRKAKAGADPVKGLADPQVWELLRKIAAHKKLRDDVAKLAEKYPDPAAD